MAKTITRVDSDLVKSANEQALTLLKRAFAEARDRGTAAEPGAKPPLFPNGIELLRVKFEISIGDDAKLAIEVELAGPKPPA